MNVTLTANPVSVGRSLVVRLFCLLGVLLLVPGMLRADFSEKVVNNVKASTVRVWVDLGGGHSCSGTGFVVTKGGHVVTNNHVIQGAVQIVLLLSRGNIVYRRDASIVASDPARDLAILKCDNLPTAKPLVLAVAEPAGGQSVMAIGFPGVLDDVGTNPFKAGGLSPTGRKDELQATPEALAFFVPLTSCGTVEKAFHPDPEKFGTYLAIAHSAKIAHGNSGGPLVDIEGRVIGINVAGDIDKQNGVMFAWAIHSSELANFAQANNIPVIVERSKASVAGGGSGLLLLLCVALAAFAVVMFLLVLRKPRTVMMDAVSRVARSKRSAGRRRAGGAASPVAFLPPVTPPRTGGGMRLRGRDLRGLSYDIAFTEADFRRSGGRLVIGRNGDLSQLFLSHDSVSRQHATLTLQGGTVLVEDRNSGNGTKVNGRDLAMGSPPAPLRSGDKLTLGEVDLVFEILN